MSKCERCAGGAECIESCIDCECASCIRHDENDFCGLGIICDRFEEDVRVDDDGGN